MYVTVAFLWISVWRFQDLWPIIGKLQVPILLEVTLALTLAASLRGPRSPKWLKSRIFVIPFLMLALMIVGLPLSLWRGWSFGFITKVFMPILLLMAGVAFSIRDAEDANWIALAHLIGADVYSLYTYLFVAVGSDGRLSGGAHYDANDLGVMLVATLPLAIYFLRPGVKIWKRVFALVSLALYIMLIVKSGSRGAFIALICVAAYIVLAFRAIPTRVRLGAVAAATLLMVVFGSAAYWQMMKTVTDTKDDYNMTSPVGRKAIWKRGVGYMLTHPVVGVGANAFEQAEGTLSAISQEYALQNKGLKWSTAHNSFVLVGAELGITGLLLFVTLLGTMFKSLNEIKAGPTDDPHVTSEDAAFSQALIGCLIGFCVAGFFVSAAYFAYLYVLVGLAAAEISLRSRRRARVGAAQPLSIPRPASNVRPVRRGAPTYWLPTG
jgi:O-antigen ligase